jgi:hypothetical protein
MPSSSEIFHFSPNFDARVRSNAFLHRQSQTPELTCFSHCVAWFLSTVQSLADLPKVQHRDSPARHYDFREPTRERELMLRIPSVRKKFPWRSFSESVIKAAPRSGSHFAVGAGTLCTAFDGVARHAKEDPSQGASFPRRMTSAACPSNTKGIR